MSAVFHIRPDERARVDRDQLETLVRSLGPAAADVAVARALEDLVEALDRAGRRLREGDIDAVRTTVRLIVQLSRQLGFTTLARVGRDVLETCASCDSAALSATMARLERVGEGSLQALWDLQDLRV
ncbi:MAG: hypothetical protein D6801_00500 [Alphaproteobacteria bacterium]|nr:MAG: hypothetical protein D6801_00500 [Alphaproteobacteria bacterium]